MNAAPATKYISIEEYLAAEEVTLEKHKYYKGKVFAMAGASIEHNRIISNTLIAIGIYLTDKSCEIFPSGSAYSY